MKRHIRYIILGLGVIFCLTVSGCRMKQNEKGPLRILILSGSNNHDWEATTPMLQEILESTEFFVADITERPDTLKQPDLDSYAAIVSNWNSWPENDLRWSRAVEVALLNYIQKGGGLVTFHSSTSAFYRWPEFQEITAGSWIMDSTWHGKPGPVSVVLSNNEHPVTRGMKDFSIYDELWVNARGNEKYTTLGTVTNEDIKGKGIAPQPAIMVYEYGKGRIFHTLLGHDVRAMQNDGFQTLLLRGTVWAALGKVSPDFISEQEKP